MRIEAPVDPVDVDAGDRGQEHGRDEERQDQQRVGGVRARRIPHDQDQGEQHHVAADLGDELRQPEPQEVAVLEDLEGARLLGDRCLGDGHGRLGPGPGSSPAWSSLVRTA